LRSTLFPQPPSLTSPNWEGYKVVDWNWSKLASSELALAYSVKIKGKTPSLDRIIQKIINKVYLVISEIFYKVFAYLIDLGYHPRY
jgi:hypothetical protein